MQWSIFVLLLNVHETPSNNSKARKRTGLRQRVLLMSRAWSLRHNLTLAPLPFLILEPLKKVALSAVGTPVHGGLWAPGSTQLPGTPELCCELELDCSSRAGAEEEGTRQQMVSKETNTHKHSGKQMGEPKQGEHYWDDVEKSRAAALLCMFIGWVTKALQKRTVRRKLLLFWRDLLRTTALSLLSWKTVEILFISNVWNWSPGE